MSERDSLDSPWIQAGRLTFLALYAVTVLAALAWAFSNVRQIDPQNRAVVLHFGALDRIQNAGLLLAWPRPFEQVVLLPAADRVIERRVENLLRSDAAIQADRVASFATPLSDALAGSGYLLTGDAGVVQLDVRVFYKVTEPYAFVLQGDHVLPALDRLVTRSAVALTAAPPGKCQDEAPLPPVEQVMRGKEFGSGGAPPMHYARGLTSLIWASIL